MISIVIPALNEEKLLPDCLRSLSNQDYTGAYEIIVADNGSTDNTAGIARKFGARVIACPEVKSVFYARQAGADAAGGDIIAQADADSVYPGDWLRRIADKFASCPEVVAITGRFVYRNSPWWAVFEYFLRSFGNWITALFGMPLVVSGATLAFRRWAYVSAGGYRGLSYSADQIGISRRLSKLGKVIYDKNLSILTSSRAVQKPVFVIFKDFLTHLIHWTRYSLKSPMTAFYEFTWKTRARRLATSLLPSLALVLAFTAYGYFIPSSPVFGRVYAEKNTDNKVVALTFDDGPNEPYTSQILDILAADNVKATFFVIGQNVELYPDSAARIIAEGNVLGNHSYNHHANHALTEYGARDMEKAEYSINQTLGVLPYLYRPPHGKKSPWELQAVKKLGMIEVTWSVSANDQHVFAVFGHPTPQIFAREIVKDVEPGSIILLHDGYGTLHDTALADRSLTVKSLPLIIQQLEAKGYKFVTVPELLNVPAYIGVTHEPGALSVSSPPAHR
jgi:peptidoglycan/xylan/chitin deacetylase (PgdA/CDA1 family)